MKEYFIHDGSQQKGPYSLEEILKQGIASETMIWHSGQEYWIAAKNMEEFKTIFGRVSPPPITTQSPPPIDSQYQSSSTFSTPPVKKSKSWFWKFLLGIFVLGGIGFIVVVNRNSSLSNTSSSRSYSENKMSVADFERANPSQFLDASGTYRETILGNKMRVNGTVTNKASVANYKDIVIEVSYYSATKTLIEKERFVLYEFVPAHSTKSFEWKIKPPSGTNTMGWDAIGGVGY